MARTWRAALGDRIPSAWAEEIDSFESQIALRKTGKIDEKVFAETRLRRGAYGQRYDNGRRNDGEKIQSISYPTDLTKGPDTKWDAPGMMRIKIPFGGLTPEQLEVHADLAEEYSDSIAHVTTRQDFQLHFVHIDDTPDLMRRLAAVGITTREACGNSVRNVTACPIAGVCRDEAFDVTPYAKATAFFLLGHKDTQDFGRKFKISFSGCAHLPCALARLHDLGAVARVQDGRRGFEIWVGGGLGPVPYQAKRLSEFLPEEELLPVAQAIGRVFARLGEKKNRNRARIKFLVDKLGADEFRRLVEEERKILPHEDAWTSYLPEARRGYAPPAEPTAPAQTVRPTGAFDEWRTANAYIQKQEAWSTVTVALPLGDLTAIQLRGLADIARTFLQAGEDPGMVRTTVDQNLVLRWVRASDLPAVHTALSALGLAEATAGTIVDVTACPGTDTCKLGIASSRGLAAQLRRRLAESSYVSDEAVGRLVIKVSGCPNSCGQHHAADLGFYGASRVSGGFAVPHFQVVLGADRSENAREYGLAIGAVPSKNIPLVVDRLLTRYLAERSPGERFRDYVGRLGKKNVKAALEDLTKIPSHDVDRSYYSDWRDPREYTLGDIGVGECAGEVVSLTDFGLSQAEAQVFAAQERLEEGDDAEAARLAKEAMRSAILSLVRRFDQDAPSDDAPLVAAFRTHLLDPGRYSVQFAQYFLRSFGGETSRDARRLVEEAQLVIEGSHDTYAKLLATPASAQKI